MNRLSFEVKTLNLEEIVLTGSFEPNGTGAPLAVTGLGFTVTKVAATTGAFLVTLNDEYMQLIDAVCDLNLVTPTHQDAMITAINVESGGSAPQTFTIVTFDTSSGSAADISAVTGNAVSFEVTVLNTKAPPTVSAT